MTISTLAIWQKVITSYSGKHSIPTNQQPPPHFSSTPLHSPCAHLSIAISNLVVVWSMMIVVVGIWPACFPENDRKYVSHENVCVCLCVMWVCIMSVKCKSTLFLCSFTIRLTTSFWFWAWDFCNTLWIEPYKKRWFYANTKRSTHILNHFRTLLIGWLWWLTIRKFHFS